MSTIDKAIKDSVLHDEGKIVNKYKQIFAAISASSSMAFIGYVYGTSSFMVPQLEMENSAFRLTPDQSSWFASIMLIGGLVGNFLGGIQSDFLGRRFSLMIDNSIFIASTVVMVTAPNFILLLIGRFMSGYAASSALISASVYNSEISQQSLRGLTIALNMLTYNIGQGVIALLGASFSWRVSLALSTISPVLGIIALFFCPETPIWLLRTKKREAMMKSLQFLRGDPEVISREVKRMETAQQLNAEDKLSSTSTLKKLKDLFHRPSFLKPFFLALTLLLVGNELSGFTNLTLYMVTIFKESKLPIDPYTAAAIVNVYKSVLSLFAPAILLRVKRRPIMFSCGSLMGISTFTFALHIYLNENTTLLEDYPWTSWIPLLSCMLMMTGFSCGFSIIISFASGEMLPPDTRSYGAGIVGLIDTLLVFALAKSLPFLVTHLKLYGLFWLHSGFIFGLLVVVFFCMPEIHGLTLEEIEALFAGKKIEDKETIIKEFYCTKL